MKQTNKHSRRFRLLFVALTVFGITTHLSGGEPKAAANKGQNRNDPKAPMPPLAVARLEVPRVEVTNSRSKPRYIAAIAFSGDMRSVIAAVNDDHSLLAWDLATGKVKWQTAAHPCSFQSVACSLDGKLVCAAETLNGRNPEDKHFIYLLDQQTGQEIRKWPVQEHNFNKAAFSPDGKWLATGGDGAGVAVWDTASARRVFSTNPLADSSDHIISFDFSGDGRYLGVMVQSRHVLIYDWQNNERVFSYLNEREALNYVGCVRRVGDGKTLAWVVIERYLRGAKPSDPQSNVRIVFWNQDSRKIVSQTDLPNANRGGDAAVAPDGRTLALEWNSGAERKAVTLDLATGKQLVVLSDQGSVSLPTFSADGSLLATRGSDSTILVWQMQPARLEGYWSWLASRLEPDVQLGTEKLILHQKDSLSFLTQRIGRIIESHDKLLPVFASLGSPKFAERDAAEKDLRNRFAEVETFAYLFRDHTSSAEAKRRVEALLPDLKPREKEPPVKGMRYHSEAQRLTELKRFYGEDYMIYPDTPGAAEFRSVSRVFAVLERIDSPEVKAFLETLAKRPAGDWFAVKAAESLKRMKK